MRKSISILAGFAALVLCAPSFGDAANYDPKPWLEDLAQTREVFLTKYANLEWAVFDREAKLPELFADTQKRIENGKNDADARAAFDRLAKRLGDGHVEFQWPQLGAWEEGGESSMPCSDYTSAIVNLPMAALAPGYREIKTAQSDVFPIGMMEIGKHHVGVLRIALFEPQGFPQLCQAALASLSIPADKPCGDDCQQTLSDDVNRRFTEDFIAQVETLKSAGADTLLVDITHNGGGNDWAEAASRMLVRHGQLLSEMMYFVRGEHWAKHFAELEKDMRKAAKTANHADRKNLLRDANNFAKKKRLAEAPCDAEPLWEGKHPSCAWLLPAYSATGALASGGDLHTLRGKPWAVELFTPMAFPFRPGVWSGPLMVLVDSETWSAAEEFAAELQDNHAATIIGEPTGGAGCGHTDGGTPTTLKNSHAILEVPDCARIRADGTNEVRGIRPDVLVGWRKMDGRTRRAADFAAMLPDAIKAAENLGRTAP